MNILVVGSGGREHALCWALARSATVFCAPGNPGTAAVGTNLPLDPTEHRQVVSAIRAHRIDLTVIGPEAPLAAGLVDEIEHAGLRAFGPSAAAARIEASKAYAKDVMVAAGVPTPAGRSFRDEAEALSFIASHDEPLVVKASGLAAGKGVIVCDTRGDAADAARAMFRGRFGRAGAEVVVEECLEGEELSVLGITDGEQVMLLPASQDHKRLGEGDQGPNTGGMGAYTPVSVASETLLGSIATMVFKPVLDRLAATGAPYKGVLYAGLMLGDRGPPSVLEFNCRFGDPEAQVVLPVLREPLGEHMWSIASGERWSPTAVVSPGVGAAVTTVLASPGYPRAPRTGATIELPAPTEHGLVFHAGTVVDADGMLRTAGGRVLCATGMAEDVPEAARRSQALAAAIDFEGKVFRRDIGWREIARAGAS